MKNTTLRAILRAIIITVGLNLLYAGVMILFSHLVHRESGQALLFLTVTLLLLVAVCLFAAIPTTKRSALWACFGVSSALHVILTVVAVLLGGTQLSEAWPGYDNLAWLLLALMSLAVWYTSIFVITVVRSRRIGKVIRDEKWQVKSARKYAKKGYRKEWQTLGPARARFLAILRGSLLVLWFHLLTGLSFALLDEWGLAETMLGYVTFPLLWCLLAAAYGLHDRENRVSYALSAALCNLLGFLLSTTLLTIANTPSIRYRFILQLDSVLTEPFENPEQLLSLGIFLSVWIAMLIFGIGHRHASAPAMRASNSFVTAPASTTPPSPEAVPAAPTASAAEIVPENPVKHETETADAPAESTESSAEPAPEEPVKYETETTDAPTESTESSAEPAPEIAPVEPVKHETETTDTPAESAESSTEPTPETAPTELAAPSSEDEPTDRET